MTAYTIMNLDLGDGWVLAKHRRHSDGVHGIILTHAGRENAFGFKTIAELERQVRAAKRQSWQKAFDHSIFHRRVVEKKQG